MNAIEFSVMESRIESAENRIRDKHNCTCKIRDIMPYENRKLIKMIKVVGEALKDN